MNSFDSFKLTGANIARYIPIFGDATKIIGAYRKYAEPCKNRELTLGIGQTPLFLLDGEVNAKILNQAVEKLRLTKYVAIYRSFDLNIRKDYERLYRNVCGIGCVKKDGTPTDSLRNHLERLRTEQNEVIKSELAKLTDIKMYLAYEKTRNEYSAALNSPPIDASTGNAITGDINEYLYERAKTMYPLGVESVLEDNIKQTVMPKLRYFVDGLEDSPPPNGVRYGQAGRQITLFDSDRTEIGDSIKELGNFIRQQINQEGVAKLQDIIRRCAEIGLYKTNITLYAIGAVFRDFRRENAIFYDGRIYWKYREVQDISMWILHTYERLERRRGVNDAEQAIFYDSTTLKQRLEQVFDIEPIRDKRLDTLGMTTLRIGRWIIENMNYPIAFLDNTLYRLLYEHGLYGERLQQYNEYFTAERCEYIKERIPHADSIAREAIKEAVGFDPDTTTHGMSGLPKGHYAPMFYSAERYIEEMIKEKKIKVK